MAFLLSLLLLLSRLLTLLLSVVQDAVWFLVCSNEADRRMYWLLQRQMIDDLVQVKPSILIGLSGAGPLFTSDVLTAMGECNERPIIFPMSNPTYRSECTSDDAQKYTGVLQLHV